MYAIRSYYEYAEQKRLLAQAEIKLLQAQVNPHFLFNALNTLAAVIRRDPEHARRLVHHLSTFFRKNLKRSGDEVSLRDELEHVHAYLQIEQARFADRLQVEIAIPVITSYSIHYTKLYDPGRLRARMRIWPASSSWEVPCLMAFSTTGCRVKAGSLASSRFALMRMRPAERWTEPSSTWL